MNERQGYSQEEFLEWAGMTAETWKNKQLFIRSKGFSRLVQHDLFDYDPILRDNPNQQLALRRISFEHARTLWEYRNERQIYSLADLRCELSKYEGFCTKYDLESESELIWRHEMAHDREGRLFGIESKFFVFRADQDGYTVGLINNISSLRKRVEEGLNLAYFYARVLSAPWRQGEFHYNNEDRLAIDLFKAAKIQGTELLSEDTDLVKYWSERFLPNNLKTPRIWEKYRFPLK